MSRPVIVLELNELCPKLIDRFIGEGLLPNFQRLKAGSEIFITKPDVEEASLLEPWIQWYSIHTGLPYATHKVFYLTDGPLAPHEDWWSLLKAKGDRVMSVGSMNTRSFDGEGNVYLADPWCTTQRAYPDELNLFQDIVGTQVREYTNAENQLTVSKLANFGWFMARRGLSGKTVASVATRLAKEVMVDRALSYQRVAILDRLQLDVFAHYYRQTRPKLATFFANSVAHLQHAYWRHMEPEAFQVQPSAGEIAKFKDAIAFGYQAMDGVVGDVLDLARQTGARVVFATALSQQPFLRLEGIGGQTFYRPRNVEAMLASFGIKAQSVEPTMTHQFQCRFATADEAQEAARILGQFTRGEGGARIFDFNLHSDTCIYFNNTMRTLIGKDERVVRADTGASFGFYEMFYQIELTKGGCHHPDGCLWIQSETPADHSAERVSILDIFPTVMALVGREALVPADRSGVSLLGRVASKLAA